MTALDPNDYAGLGFFKLCTLLDRSYPDAPGIGDTRSPSEERARFRATPTLGFPPGDISALRAIGSDGQRLEVTVNFLGLFGPSSPLPPHYTERVMHADAPSTLGDFLDFFNHRLVGLLYQCWRSQRYEVRYVDGATDSMSDAVSAFIGLFDPAEREEDRNRRVLLLPYAGLLSLYSRSRTVIAGVIAHFLGVPCSIEEFVPRQIDIPAEARCFLGSSGTLGRDTLIGESMIDVTGRFRVQLGPLGLAQYRDLLPGQPARAMLQRLLDLMVREPLDWVTSLELAPGEAEGLRLGQAEIGWTSFLGPPGDKSIMVQL